MLLSADELVTRYSECAQHPTALIPYAVILDTVKGLIPWEDWPHNRQLLDDWRHENLSIVLKSRQLGVSWTAALYALWTAKFVPGANVLLVSQTLDDAVDLLAKCRVLEDHFPDWLRYTRGKDNDTELSFPVMNSRIKALPSTERAGRSNQGTLVILDEFARHEYAEESLVSLIPTVGDSGQLIVVSTAQGAGGPFYSLWNAAEERHFQRHFIAWNARPDRDAAWYERKVREIGEKIKQEYPNDEDEAFLQSGRSVFKEGLEPLSALVQIPASQMPDEVPEETLMYRVRRKGYQYLIGVDVGEGLPHGDLSSAIVLERDPLGRCVEAAHLCGLWPTDRWALMIDGLASYYGGLMAVERNSIGHAVLDHLRRFQAERSMKGEKIGYRLYSEQDILKSPTARGAAKVIGRVGWLTSTSSKPVAIEELESSLRTRYVQYATPHLTTQLRAYKRDEKGRTGAVPPDKDDCVMALAIALQMQKWIGVEAQDWRNMPKVKMV